MAYTSSPNEVKTHAAHVKRFADFRALFPRVQNKFRECRSMDWCGASVFIILGSLGLAAGRLAQRPYDGNYSTVIVIVAVWF